MILSLMFHHINNDVYSNDVRIIGEFFKYISSRYETVFPNEYAPSLFGGVKLCLVFDDGYFDFYHYVYPLLVRYDLKAVLAVSPKFILDQTSLDPSSRLCLRHGEMMESDNYKEFVPFCTWDEMLRMSGTGHVQIASHGLNHVSLTELDDKDVMHELNASKEIIEAKLCTRCDSFVYPYGRFNGKITKMVRTTYRYDFAIGGAFNYALSGRTAYRVYADDMTVHNELLTTGMMLCYLLMMIKMFLRKMHECR